MSRRSAGVGVALLGVGFLVYYLVVRLVFMSDLDAAVARAGVHDVGEILANLSPPIVAWLLWAYSFRLGMLLAVIGGALHAGAGRRGVAMLALGGVAYLATCYLPFIGYSPRYYGLLGTGILVLFLYLVRDWALRRPRLTRSARVVSDLRMAGHFLLVMATWSLCGIFGIVTYALQPEIMLARGLQTTAVALTAHVMAELTLGWFLLFLASRREAREAAASEADESRPTPATT